MLARRLGLTAVLVATLAAACSPIESPAPGTPAASAPAPSGQEIAIICAPDAQAPPYLGDPCPAATVAVELAVAPMRLPIVRIVIEAGPFFCNDIWPGVGIVVPCYEPMVQPGQFMHAWVSFAQSTEVAAVLLGRDLPLEIGSPLPTPPPWTATLVKAETPPAGWSMP